MIWLGCWKLLVTQEYLLGLTVSFGRDDFFNRVVTVDVGSVLESYIYKKIQIFMAPLFLLFLTVLREWTLVSFGRDEISHFRRLIFYLVVIMDVCLFWKGWNFWDLGRKQIDENHKRLPVIRSSLKLCQIVSHQAVDFFGRRSVLVGMKFLCRFLNSITTRFWAMTISCSHFRWLIFLDTGQFWKGCNFLQVPK